MPRISGNKEKQQLAARDEEHDAIPLEYLLYPMGACWSRARAAAGVRGVGRGRPKNRRRPCLWETASAPAWGVSVSSEGERVDGLSHRAAIWEASWARFYHGRGCGSF
jgi:hypothetical protein